MIDELEANFERGLNVITGETGAGKSILINAIDLAFSTRVSKDVIKTGREKAVIELTIDDKILTKEITKSGSRTRLDGVVISAEEVKELRAKYLDIHSQHQTYTFLQPKYHITLLDNYAKNEKLAIYREKFAVYRQMQTELETLQSAADKTQSELEFLRFQIDEISAAELKGADEVEVLKAELEVLENAEKLQELTGIAYWAINGDEGSVLESLGKIKQNVSKAASFDAKLARAEQQLTEALETLRETGSELRDYSQGLKNNTQRFNEIQERMFLLDKLCRKYGDPLGTLEKLSAELAGIEFSDAAIEELGVKIAAERAELQVLAAQISETRQNYAQVLSSLVQDKLEKLELPKVRFKIDVQPAQLGADGADSVEFLIAANISDDLKPLARVASGGEISRVMLALKSIFAAADEIDTVIFDEIDTGVSGRAAQSVADEITELAKSRQIILITHQAIIASKADKHFYVKKSQLDETLVEVYVLSGENRLKALAELAGGEINEQSMQFAQSLLAG